MKIKGRNRAVKRSGGIWWHDLDGDDRVVYNEKCFTLDLRANRLIPAEPVEWHEKQVGKPINKRMWVFVADYRVVAVAVETFIGSRQVDIPLFGFWMFMLSDVDKSKLPEVPLSKLLRGSSFEWEQYFGSDGFTEIMLRHERLLIAGQAARVSDFDSPKENSEMVVATKGKKSDAGSKRTKRTKRTESSEKEEKAVKEKKMTIAKFLYGEVFVRDEVGTDEDIIEECREKDYCSQKFRDDDASAKQQLAWHKNRYRKGEFPDADPEQEYDVLQEFASNKKRDTAQNGEDSPPSGKGKRSKGKRSKKKATPEVTEMNRKELKAVIKKFELDIDPKSYPILEEFQEVVGEELEDL